MIIHYGNVPPFIATLGMMGVARGVALLITGGYPFMGFSTDFQWIGAGGIVGIPFTIILAATITGGFYVLLKFTPMGRRFYAIGGNQEAARLSGVNVGWVKIWAYTIAGFCAAVGGIVLASMINSAPPSAGDSYALNAIAAVVIGGTNLFGGEGTVIGTAIGALIMAVIGNGLSLLNVTSFWQQVIIGIVIILAVMMTTIRLKKR
jgi:ribose transport system permease protein